MEIILNYNFLETISFICVSIFLIYSVIRLFLILLSWIWFKIIISNKKEDNIHKSKCICEENSKGNPISGWCSEHHTDWF